VVPPYFAYTPKAYMPQSAITCASRG